MDVLFDARLLHRALSGLERVQRNLLFALSHRPEVDRLRVLVRPGTELPRLLRGRVEPVEVHSSEAILAILLDPDRRPDVYHLSWFPDSTPRDVWLPLAAPASVVQVHDAILNRHPEYLPSREAWEWYHGFCKTLVRNADALLCHSESVAREIRDDLDGDIDRAVVAPLAVEGDLRRPLDGSEVRDRLDRLGIGGADFFLMVGKDYPHKDHPTAFRALAQLPGDSRLVIAGCKVWKEGQVTESLLRELAITPRVSWHQGLSDDDVKALIQGARAVLYPSLEEGFGLPPIEAMALGTPALAAAAMSIPEVCGDGALLFEPGDHRALAAAMDRCLKFAVGHEDPGIAQLIERGRAREAEFTWDRTAANTVTCYQLALERAQRRPRDFDRADLLANLAVTAGSRFDESALLAAWQERCHSVEHKLEQMRQHVTRLEQELTAHDLTAPKAPAFDSPPPIDQGDNPPRPRWSIKRRLQKICNGLLR